MIVVTTVCLALLAAAAVLGVLKLIRANSFADRVVSTDLLLGILTTGIGVGTVATGDGVLLNLIVVTALLGFVGTVTVARFMEHRGN